MFRGWFISVYFESARSCASQSWADPDGSPQMRHAFVSRGDDAVANIVAAAFKDGGECFPSFDFLRRSFSIERPMAIMAAIVMSPKLMDINHVIVVVSVVSASFFIFDFWGFGYVNGR